MIDGIRVAVTRPSVVDGTIIGKIGPALVVPKAESQKVIETTHRHINGNEVARKVGNKRADPSNQCNKGRETLEKTWLLNIVRNGLRETT